MRRIVVTGASRGLGLEFCRQYLEKGEAVVGIVRPTSSRDGVGALARDFPDRFHVAELDVANPMSCADFGEQVCNLPVDILINNAGIIGPETHKGETGQNISSFDPAIARSLFETNALAPLNLTLLLLPSLRRVKEARAIVLGSTVGIVRETFGDYYSYRMSKAAAHIAFATLAKDLGNEDIIAAVVCPGWVRTDMGGGAASLSAQESVEGMIRVIDALKCADSGCFIDYSGNTIAF